MNVESSRASRQRLIGIVAVAVLVAAALVASLAIAHNKAFSNQVSLTKAVPYGPALAVYQGRVTSPRANCERNREVQIFNVTANPDVRVARTRTTPAGAYKVKGAQVPNGNKVQALIETKVLPAPPGHNHTCNVDRSPNVVYPHP
jgi:hypothetical protein